MLHKWILKMLRLITEEVTSSFRVARNFISSTDAKYDALLWFDGDFFTVPLFLCVIIRLPQMPLFSHRQ